MGRFFILLVSSIATITTIRAASFVTKWVAGTAANAGQDCHLLCLLNFNSACDVTINGEWPETKEKLQKIVRENNLPCDKFCQRQDFGEAPVITQRRKAPQCDYDTPLYPTERQCIFGKPYVSPGARPRCSRKFGGRIRICPCMILPTTVTATTIATTTATTASTTSTSTPTPSTTSTSTTATTIPLFPMIAYKQYPVHQPAVIHIHTNKESVVILAVTIVGTVFGVLMFCTLIVVVTMYVLYRARRGTAAHKHPENLG